MAKLQEKKASEITAGEVVVIENGQNLRIHKVVDQSEAFGAGTLQLCHDGEPSWTFVDGDDLISVIK